MYDILGSFGTHIIDLSTHPTAPSGVRSVVIATGRSEGDIVIGLTD